VSAPRASTAAIGRVAGAATLAAMIATPLNRQGGPNRRWLSSVVVSGLALTTGAISARRWGAGRVGVAAVTVGGATAAVERIGTGTGVPFGGYEYTGALRPQIAGVPAIVPLAWFAMAVPAREAATAALDSIGRPSTPATRIVAGAAALTAWDLFLDPQMVGEGYWRWFRRGAYRGIPLSNFLGWFLTGLGVMAVLELVLPPGRAGADPVASSPTEAPTGGSPTAGASPELVGVYATMAVMETIGFAAYFKDRLVALVGGVGMLVPALLAGVGIVRRGASGR
jgi:uncharacterized membrane protein